MSIKESSLATDPFLVNLEFALKRSSPLDHQTSLHISQLVLRRQSFQNAYLAHILARSFAFAWPWRLWRLVESTFSQPPVRRRADSWKCRRQACPRGQNILEPQINITPGPDHGL
ncbi:hypothetical protein N7481_009539 [Penicillium waksmanii]|uniref:uncharacterized protein n=1 Tax=Penicillium waksmanii TaxID=69791 RepID=UPI0025482297|nr:uncharacterized protein N7481_009539 [Penicillium waksmanii]KAJ5975832.1 hypothetical protein N7481_009539 [Penicillium waksmanii]